MSQLVGSYVWSSFTGLCVQLMAHLGPMGLRWPHSYVRQLTGMAGWLRSPSVLSLKMA